MASTPPPTRSTRTRRAAANRLAAVGVAALICVPLVACSGDDEPSDAASDDVEAQIEKELGGDADVSIDPETGQVEVDTGDGTKSFGSSSEVPDGFPESIPLPADATLTTSMADGNGDDQIFSVGGSVQGAAADVFADIAAQFTGAGWDDIQSDASTPGAATGSIGTFDDGTWQVTVNVADAADGSVATFSYSVIPSP